MKIPLKFARNEEEIFELCYHKGGVMDSNWYFIREGPLSKLSPLKKYPKTNFIEIKHSGLTTLEDMPVMPNLTHFFLFDYDIEDFKGFPPQPMLEKLTLGNKFTSFKHFPVMPRLKELRIKCNHIHSFEHFPVQPALETLEIEDTQLKNLAALPQLPNLKKLRVANCSLETLENFPYLPRLKVLNLRGNRLKTIEGLPDLPNLKNLSLSDNQIKSLEILKPLSNVEVISVSGCPITDLNDLPFLPNLGGLGLEKTSLKDHPNFNVLAERTPNLEGLDLSNTGIERLDSFPNLPYLSSLGLQNTKISSLEPLKHLKRIMYLYLEGSMLENFSGMPVMIKNPEGGFVDEEDEHEMTIEYWWLDLPRKTLYKQPEVARKWYFEKEYGKFSQYFNKTTGELIRLAENDQLPGLLIPRLLIEVKPPILEFIAEKSPFDSRLRLKIEEFLQNLEIPVQEGKYKIKL